ncbi:MAG: LacI family DNA-binding transcriptional regulator [Bacteroidota bacterium]
MSDRIRIKDIAQYAGVSEGTVDRVIHKRGNVSKKSKDSVLKAMQELNYRPNQIASVLAYNRTWTIAVLMPHPKGDAFWQQPAAGVKKAREVVRDYGVMVKNYYFNGEQPITFTQATEKILKNACDAVLIAPIFLQESLSFFDRCEANNIPYALINTFIDRKSKNALFYLGQDSYQSGFLAAKLLTFGLSSNETALILHMEKSVVNAAHLLEKEKGFEDYFSQNQSNDIRTAKASFSELNNELKFQKFIDFTLKNHPSTKGVFVTTSRIFHLVRQLEKMNIHHLKLVGFDLIEENLNFLYRDKIDFLINQNPVKQGYLGILELMNYLVFKKMPKANQHLPLDVVMRENVVYYLLERENVSFMV